MNTTPFRSGYVAIVGYPNAGKSTLMNTLIGEKIAIVTPKAQTTRHRIMGIYSTDSEQIIFQDTPGYLEPEYPLHEKMMDFALSGLKDADVIIFLLDPTREGPVVHPLLIEHLHTIKKKPIIGIVNKVDIASKEQIQKTIAEAKLLPFEFISFHKISATQPTSSQILPDIISKLPEQPAFFPPDDISTHSLRFIASELIREKIFLQYDQEIPYATSVQIIDYKEREDGSDWIEAEIVVERDGQKIIVIGRKGIKIKQLGIQARKEIEALTGRKTVLKLFVKVRDKWRKNNTFLQDFGYLE